MYKVKFVCPNCKKQANLLQAMKNITKLTDVDRFDSKGYLESDYATYMSGENQTEIVYFCGACNYEIQTTNIFNWLKTNNMLEEIDCLDADTIKQNVVKAVNYLANKKYDINIVFTDDYCYLTDYKCENKLSVKMTVSEMSAYLNAMLFGAMLNKRRRSRT